MTHSSRHTAGHRDNYYFCSLICEAAALGASMMREARARGTFTHKRKADRSLVTEIDVAVEKAVGSFLREAIPQSILVSEEGVAPTSSARPGNAASLAQAALTEQVVFILDPIDGTNNFAHGLPETAVSLGCVVNNELIAGVVHAPFLNTIYTATKGGGAFRNNLRITASSATELSEVLVSTGFPYLSGHEHWYEAQIQRIRRVGIAARDVRRNGACSIDMCRVADGTFGGFFETVQPWDAAAGRLIAHEAGATIGRYEPAQYTAQWEARSRELNIEPKILCELTSGDAIIMAAAGVFDELQKVLQGA